MELKHSRQFIQSIIQFIQWNSYSDRVARLYLPVLRNAFRTIVGLIAYQLVEQVPLTTRNDISAPSDLTFRHYSLFHTSANNYIYFRK